MILTNPKAVINMKTLSSLSYGERAKVSSVEKSCSVRRRLIDIGLVGGAEVTCLQTSLFGDPTAYLIRNAVIALRRADADSVYIE